MTRGSGMAGSFERILENLYAGTLDDALWNRALVEVADTVRAAGAYLFAVNPATGVVLRDENHRVDPSVSEAYCRYWTYQDMRRKPFLEAEVGVPQTEESLQIPNLRSTALFNDFLLAVDHPHFMPVWLRKSDTKMVALSFQGTRKRGPFERRDTEQLRRLSPHISRALEIRDRLERVQIRAHTLSRSLDTLSFGVAVLDSTGKLLEANAIARDLFREDCGICYKSDGTVYLRGSAGSELHHWISTGMPPARRVDGLLHISQAVGPPLSVLVSPLPAQSVSWISGDPRWLLLFFDPSRQIRLSTELIARDLCITNSEAAIVAMVVAGNTLKESALCLGISEHTARSQIKSVFRKTDIRSQADLVRRVALGAARSEPS
jgi:DNA-binding CsgD family transcriptional regulator/PAS domain-containing protein